MDPKEQPRRPAPRPRNGISLRAIEVKDKTTSGSSAIPIPTENTGKAAVDESEDDDERKRRETVGDYRRTLRKNSKTKGLKRGLHFYSKEIAAMINSKQPDIVGAVVLYGLTLWQNNTYKQTLIDGKRYSFRSLSKLQEDHKYLKKSAIHKVLVRLEKRFGKDFIIKRDKKMLWFAIGSTLIKKMDRTGLDSYFEFDKITGDKNWEVRTARRNRRKLYAFYIEDAKKTGCVRSAVLLANLKYALSIFKDPKRDIQGNKYVELSPAKLKLYLNYSEDTTSRLLKKMCDDNHLIRHTKAKSFYALSEGFVTTEEAEKSDKAASAEVHNNPAEVHDNPAEIHSETAEVHSGPPAIALEPLKNKGRHASALGTYSNESINESKKCIKEGISMTSSASPRCHPDSSLKHSKGLMMLEQLSEAKRQMHQKPKALTDNEVKVRASPLTYDFISGELELPYEVITDQSDMPYDYIASSHVTLEEWLQDQMEEMKEFWKAHGQKCDKDDLKKLRQLFSDNQHLTASDLKDIYPSTKDDVESTQNTKGTKSKRWSRILDKAKTPKAFLKYLWQIILLTFNEIDFESVDRMRLTIPDRYYRIDFSFLGKVPNTFFPLQEGFEIQKEYVEEESNPIVVVSKQKIPKQSW